MANNDRFAGISIHESTEFTSSDDIDKLDIELAREYLHKLKLRVDNEQLSPEAAFASYQQTVYSSLSHAFDSKAQSGKQSSVGMIKEYIDRLLSEAAETRSLTSDYLSDGLSYLDRLMDRAAYQSHADSTYHQGKIALRS